MSKETYVYGKRDLLILASLRQAKSFELLRDLCLYVYDDVTYVYDDVTYVYDDVTYELLRHLCLPHTRRL